MIRSFLVTLVLACLSFGHSPHTWGDYLDPAPSAVIAWPSDIFAAALPGVTSPPVASAPVDELARVAPPVVRRTTSGPGIGQWRKA